jgi:hypothetical protein
MRKFVVFKDHNGPVAILASSIKQVVTIAAEDVEDSENLCLVLNDYYTAEEEYTGPREFYIIGTMLDVVGEIERSLAEQPIA